MSKADDVLAEINKQNYYLDAIAQATGTNTIKVSNIISKLVSQGKLDGEVNEEQNMYVPGYTSPEYLRNIRFGVLARILAPLSFILATILPIVFVVSVSTGGGFLIEQWKINMFYIIDAVVLLVCFSSLVVSIMTRRTKTGKIMMGFTIVALVFTLMVTLMVLLFTTVFQSMFGNFI